MLKGLGGLGDMAKMMKAAQEMQGKMAEMQAKLEATEVEGQSGAGMVKVKLTGKGDMRRVTIDPSLMDDREVLEDLIVAAHADARTKVEAQTEAKMRELTAGLSLPAGLNLPF